MSMTLEEAIEKVKILCAGADELSSEYEEQGSFIEAGMAVTFKNAFDTILSALRPVSREQVEKVWTGCEKCRDQANWPSWIEKGFVYCPKCGTPLTSWAWEKQVERLEALNDAVD